MKVTIRDVARLSKVSRTTVSRVMHNHRNVSPESKKRVLKTINQLKYDPLKNIPFVQKSKQLSRTIALVSPTNILEESGFFLNKAIIEFNNLIQAKEYRPMLYGDDTLYRNVAQGFHEWHKTMPADGFIFFCPRFQWDPAIQALSSWNVPVVLIRRETVVPGVPVVTDNDFNGVRLALDHLYQLGHHRIAVMGLRLDTETAAQGQSYRSFIKEKGWAMDESLIFDRVIHPSSADYGAWLENCLAGPAPVTAILCLDDNYAADTIRIITHLGRLVPRDLAVIGYDNTYLAEIYNPGITSVNVPVKEMIDCAAGVLFDLLENVKPQETRFEFKNELVVRESCGYRRPKTEDRGQKTSVTKTEIH